jgi:hypothetical protein
MDFVPEKPALEVDEIRGDERAAGCLPSRPGGESASVKGLSKMQTMKLRLQLRWVKRRNHPACTP